MATLVGHTPEQLAQAVASSRSWRGVLRTLGRRCDSAGTLRSVRRQVDELGIDHSHFVRQRRWTDRELDESIRASASWTEVATGLGLTASGTNLTTLRGHARRLSLDVDHLARDVPTGQITFSDPPRSELLRVAATSFAAGWFQLRGYVVLSPQEGCRYDLVIGGDSGFTRVQVKTTTRRQGNSRLAMISGTRQDKRVAYDVDEVDHFFILDDELNAYLIPFDVVAGLSTISLGRYADFRVAEAGRWLDDPVSARASP